MGLLLGAGAKPVPGEEVGVDLVLGEAAKPVPGEYVGVGLVLRRARSQSL